MLINLFLNKLRFFSFCYKTLAVALSVSIFSACSTDSPPTDVEDPVETELTSPKVLATSPYNGAVNINSLQLKLVTARFDKKLDASTVTIDNIKLLDGKNVPTPGKIWLDESGHVVNFSPENALRANTDYIFRINDTLSDDEGGKLDNTFQSHFSTQLAEVKIHDTTIDETTARAVLTVSVDRPSAPITINYATQGISATENKDFITSTGSILITEHDTAATIEVDIIDDKIYEKNEFLKVNLTDIAGATIEDYAATVTILDNENEPKISIDNSQILESQNRVDAIVSLSNPSAYPVTVKYNINDGTAVSGDDFEAIPAALLTFLPTEMLKPIHITITDDDVGESDEYFHITLSDPTGASISSPESSVTIVNDDPPSAPVLSFDGFEFKKFLFSWPSDVSAINYTLYENIDGASGFTEAGSTTASTTLSHAVDSFFTRLNASYILQACNSSGCSDSNLVPISPNLSNMLGTYVKADYGTSYNYNSNLRFGSSVALSANGKTMAVGAIGGPYQSGSVYLFSHSEAGWKQIKHLQVSNGRSPDLFGASLALSHDGNTLAVGAPRESRAAVGVNNLEPSTLYSADSGAVYVFTQNNNSWDQQAYIKASNTGEGDKFGSAVSLSADGNTLAVGAPLEEIGTTRTDNGAVYVFSRLGATWSQKAYLKAYAAGQSDYFGQALSLSADGTILAIGAHGEDSNSTGLNGDQLDNSALRSGAAYIFRLGNSGWYQQAYLKSSNTRPYDNFGISLVLKADGKTLAVGATGEDYAGRGIDSLLTTELAIDSGAVFLFEFDGASWSQQAYIKAPNTDYRDNFGRPITFSADGSVLAIGANNESGGSKGIQGNMEDNSEYRSSAVYLYNYKDNFWKDPIYIKATNTQAYDSFGHSIALSETGQTIAIGAPNESSNAIGINGDQTNNSTPGNGAVYLY